MQTFFFLIVPLGFLVCAISSAQAGEWSLAMGWDRSIGTYGLEGMTTIESQLLQMRYQSQSVLFKVEVPYLKLHSPAYTTTTATQNPFLTQTMTSPQSVEGIGDTTFTFSKGGYWDGAQKIWGEVGTKIKCPTGSASQGLGTGKADYAILMDGYFRQGKLTHFLGGGYKWVGKPANTATYQNTAFFSVGTSYRFSSTLSAGAAFDYRQSALSSSPAQQEWMAFITKRLDSKWEFQSYVYGGLTHASPRIGMGGLLKYTFSSKE